MAIEEERLAHLLAEVRSHPEEEWATRLDDLCRDDEERSAVVTGLGRPGELLQRIVERGVQGFEVPAEETLPEDGPGRYAVVRRVGQGGMGCVYEGWDPKLERRVAIKVLTHASGRASAWFARERRIQARLEHGHIARLYDFEPDWNGRPCIIMEYIDGLPIDAYCEEHCLSLEQRVALCVDLCRAVAVAHRQAAVHRDLKPSNILVTSRGEVKLLDFGVAKLLTDTEDDGLTRTGAMVGTPAYMSPEQRYGLRVDVRTDVYALGGVLSCLVTGRHPLEAQAAEAEPDRGGFSTCKPVPRRLERILRQAMQERPAARYASAAAMGDDLARYLEGRRLLARRLPRPRWQWVVSIGTLASLLLAASIFSLREPSAVEAVVTDGELIVRRGAEESWRARIEGIEDVQPASIAVRGVEAVAVAVRPVGAKVPEIRLYPVQAGLGGATPPVLETRRLGIDTPRSFFSDLEVGTIARWIDVIESDPAEPGVELIWIENGAKWYPSWIGWWNPTMNTSTHLLINSGHIREVLPSDLDADGGQDLIVRVVNNQLGYLHAAALLHLGRPNGLPPRFVSPDLARRETYAHGLTYIPLGYLTYEETHQMTTVQNGMITVARQWQLSVDGALHGRSPISPRQRRVFWKDMAHLSEQLAAGIDTAGGIAAFRAAYQDLLTAEPASDGAATIHLARTLARYDQLEGAIDLLRSAVSRELPNAPDLQLRLGELLLIHAGQQSAPVAAQLREEGIEAVQTALFAPVRNRPSFDAVLLTAIHAILMGDEELLATKALDPWKYLNQHSERGPFVGELRTLQDFCAGNWRTSAHLQPGIAAGYTTPWTAVLRLWAQLENDDMPPDEIQHAAEALQENPEVADLALLLQAWIALTAQQAHDEAHAYVNLAHRSLAEKGRTQYEYYPWLALEAYLAGETLIALGDRQGAQDAYARAAHLAPGCWWGARARQQLDD